MLKQTPPTGELAGSARRLVPARVLFAVGGAVVKSRSRMQWLLLFVVMVLMTTMAFSTLVRPRTATAATSSTLNFQARLQNASGAIVPDGTYNIQFKLYDVSTLGSALWTESYLNSASQGVTVRNGYISVSLGSITAFPTTIKWNQDLWLTMNIGGTTTGAPSYDGEMNPRLKLTANAYAFMAGQLVAYNSSTGYSSTLKFAGATVGDQTFTIPDQGAGGSYTLLTSAQADADYIQNSTTAQTGANFNIDGSGTIGTTLKVSGSGDSSFAGKLGIGTATPGAKLDVRGDAVIVTNSATAFHVQNASNVDVFNVDTTNKSVNVGSAITYSGGGGYTYGSGYATRADYAFAGSLATAHADFDGDGDQDYVRSNAAANTVIMTKNNGSGVFAAATTVASSMTSLGDAAAGDLDGDGDQDIAVVQGTNVAILKNNGSGTFAAPTSYSAGSALVNLEIADLDGDGDKDVVGVSTAVDSVVVLKNNGTGTLAAASTYATSGDPYSANMTLADLDGDGDKDIALAAGNVASVFKNNGSGAFSTRNDYGSAYTLTLADLDGDGDKDLITVGGTGNPGVRLNDGSGNFGAVTNYSLTGAVLYQATTGNLDGDSNPDIAVTGMYMDYITTSFLEGDGSGGLGYASGPSDSYDGDGYTGTTDIDLVDLDGDSDDDIVASFSDGTIRVQMNNYITGGTPPITYSSTVSVTASAINKAGLILQGASGQTADLLRVQGSDASVYLSVANNGNVGIGNVSDLSSSSYALNVAGGAQMTGNFLQTGTGTFATGSGAISLNGDITVATGKSLTVNTIQSAVATDLGIDSGTTGNINIGAGSNNKTITVGSTNAAVTQTINLGANTNASGISTVNIGSTKGTSTTNINGGSGGINLSGNTGVTGNINVSGTGSIITTTNSTSAFHVQDASSVDVFNVDTTNSRVKIGNSSGDSATATFVLDGGTQPATGVAGAMYYDTGSNSFRCYTISWGACGGDGLTGSGDENVIAKFDVDGNMTESNLSDDGSTLSYTGANILLGNGGASPAATSIKAAPASGTNVKGGDLTIDASNGTGSGGSGDIILRTAAPAAGSGAPTVGTYTRSGNGNANQLTFSHTSDSGANKLLLVQVVIQSNGASVSSVSYGGQALTKINAIGHNYNSNRVEMWYLLNPPDGTANVVVNLSAYRAVQAVAMNMTGVNQTTPLGAGSTNQGSGSTASTSVTATNLDTVVSVVSGDSGAPTVAAGQTQIWNAQQGVYGAGSYLSGTGTVTATWTGSLNNWVIAAVPVLSAASSTATNILTEGIRVTNLGRVGINASVPGAMLQAATNGAGIVGQIIQGSAGQTADLLQLKDTNGYINASFNATGNQLTLGRVATSGTVTQGKLVLADGTVSGYSVTLQSADALTANRTIKLPDASGTLCTTSSCVAGSGTDTRIARFNSSGALTDSGLTESGSSLSYTGALTVQTASALASVLTLKDTTGTVSLEVRAGNGSNALIGVGAGQNTTGGGNTALGYAALQSNVTASSNTAIGNGAMQLNTGGSGNVALGYYAYQAATGGTNNTALGAYALQYNTSGGYNIGIGTYSLGANTTGSNNIALGQYAMNSNQTGTANIALGQNALRSGSAGSYNVALGYNTLRFTGADYNVGLGYYAGYNNSTGSRNVFIGYNAGYNETGSDKLYIANNSTTALIQGDFSTSDLTFNSTLTLLGTANSATGFVIQRPSTSDTLFTANTTNNRLIVGNGSGLNANTTLFVLDKATSDPSSAQAGAMYYNTTDGKFRCYTTAWGDCAGSGGGGGSGWSLSGDNAAGSVLGSNVTTSANFVISSRPNNVGATSSGASYISFSGDQYSNANRITISGNANSNSAQGGGAWSSSNTKDYFRIQDSGGNVAFAVQGSSAQQQVFMYLAAGSSVGVQGRVCSTLTAGSSGMATIATCTNTGTDLAEAYRSTQNLHPGEIVAVDHSNYPNVVRSTEEGQDDLIGIVSTEPNETMGTQTITDGYPIALNGRVPTKVNGEGGVIHPGDKITSSSVAGVGKKATGAGMVVGTALTGFDGNGQGTIEVFVHTSYYDPAAASNMQGGNGGFTDLNVSGAATIGELHVTGDATVGGSLTVGNTLTTVKLIVGGHILSQASEAPAIEAGVAAGQDAEVTIDGTDTAGTLSVTVKAHPTDGSTPAEVLVAGELAKIAFHTPYENTPRVVISPVNADSVSAPVYLVKDQNGYKVMITAAAQDGVTYQFDYVIVGAGAATATAP